MAVRALGPDDLELFKEVRLRALRTDPGAFASTHERESAFTDSTWRERLGGTDGSTSCWFVDELDGSAAGIAGMAYTEWDPSPMLIGMWVAPEARGTGSGRRLLDATTEWAKGQAVPDIVLWVVRDNEPAVDLYARYGYVSSGKVDTLPSNPCAEELEMRLAL